MPALSISEILQRPGNGVVGGRDERRSAVFNDGYHDGPPEPEPATVFPSLQTIRATPLFGLSEAELQTRINDCSTCKGMGYIKYDLPLNHPQFGQLVPCPACKTAARELSRRKFERTLAPIVARYSTISGRLTGYTFSNYNPKVGGVSSAYNAALSWAKIAVGEETGLPWLFLYGPPGTGKTHLAAAAVAYCQQRHVPALMTTMPQLLGMIRGINAFDEKEKMLLHLCSIPVLVMDDIGAENQTSWTQENFFRILDMRYNDALPTLFIANYKPEVVLGRAVAGVGEIQYEATRELSRILDIEICKVAPLKAEDYRQRALSERR